MKKSLGWSTALLGVVLLVGAVSVSARSSSTLAKSGVGPATFAALATPSQTMTLSSSAIYTWGGDGDKYKDKDGDGDKDKDDYHRHGKRDHDPTPEPSTLLSFGAAILIGGGVLYSRRLRKSK